MCLVILLEFFGNFDWEVIRGRWCYKVCYGFSWGEGIKGSVFCGIINGCLVEGLVSGDRVKIRYKRFYILFGESRRNIYW